MRLTISGHHVDVTDGLRERISKKLRRLERHCDSIDHIEFVLVVERATHKAEANLHLAGADFSHQRRIPECTPPLAPSLTNWIDKSLNTSASNAVIKSPSLSSSNHYSLNRDTPCTKTQLLPTI